jgi:hypothetical protein
VAQVPGEPDLRHAAPSELALETVPIPESRFNAPGVEHALDLPRQGR